MRSALWYAAQAKADWILRATWREFAEVYRTNFKGSKFFGQKAGK